MFFAHIKVLRERERERERERDQVYLFCRDTNHYNQSDTLFVLPIRGKLMSRLPPYQAHQINQELCHAFLKRNLLKGKDLKYN